MIQIKVIILPGGKTCKEVNPLQKKYETYLKCTDDYERQSVLDAWQLSEDNLRTFEIDDSPILPEEFETTKIYHHYDEGKEYTAEILDNGKVKIL